MQTARSFEILNGRYRIIIENCLRVSKFFGGERSGEAAAGTRSNGHTGLLPCATYYYNYYYISIIVTLFTQRCHKNVENLEVIILKYLTLKHTIHID